jgi:hypothetical protein
MKMSWKKMICTAITAVLGGAMCANASLATDVNLIVNPGFESGVGEPWQPEGSGTSLAVSTNALNGVSSAEVTFTASDNKGIRQAFPLDAGDRLETYTLTAWINHNGQAQTVIYRLGLWEFEPGTVTFNNSNWVTVQPGTTGWQELSLTVQLSSANADSLRAVVYCAPQGNPKEPGTFLVDDVSLIKHSVAESMPVGVNVFENPGIEEATIDPWNPQGGGSSIAITNVPQNGLQSAKVNFTGDFDGMMQDLPVIDDDALARYTVSCSVNTDGYTDPMIFRAEVWEFGPGGVTFHSGPWLTVPAGSSGWVDVSHTATLTDPDATSIRGGIICAPQGSPKLAGYFLADDFSLVKELIATPFPEIDTPNLLANGEFTQATNTVNLNPGFRDDWYTVTGSLSDWTGFWGKFADLVDWTHYYADPNTPGVHTEIGTTNNPSLLADGPEFSLDGTDKFNTDFNVAEGLMNLNSAGGYRNGMMQIVSAASIDPALTYDFAVEAAATAGNDHDAATFTAGFTLGSGTAATNLANAIPGALIQMSATNLPSTAGTLQTFQVSGADLLAGGQINLLVENLNTDPIPGFPNVDPGDVTGAENVSQVRLYSVSLTAPAVFGDLDKDGYVTILDVNLANSYLDGSVDGGDDAATRQDIEIGNGNTSAEALVLLNLVDFDIDGSDYFDAADVTALEALIPPLAIESWTMDELGNFVISVNGMTPGVTYHLRRTTDLSGGTFDTIVDSQAPASSPAATMTDTSPPADAAFYRVSE